MILLDKNKSVYRRSVADSYADLSLKRYQRLFSVVISVLSAVILLGVPDAHAGFVVNRPQ